MGRYISGDIERKLWFAVQASDAADRFGRKGEPSYLEYYFDDDNLQEINKEIEIIEQSIDVKKLDEFFHSVDSYSQEDLDKRKITHGDLKEYADLCLGRDIQKCIVDTGQCMFSSEL
jgi:hypothetical protein